MSGGVDSSVAAALLKERGYDIIGITMDLYSDTGGSSRELARRGKEIVRNAGKIAARLKIPHHVVDLGREFQNGVVDAFVSEYRKGRTPNPCVRCNRKVKLGKLWKKAGELGADSLATGHYARVCRDPEEKRYRFLRGVDTAKDQSYFLWTLTQSILARTLMPLGEYDKKEVRKLAGTYRIPVADRPESQEICFIPGSYSEFIRERDPGAFRPGPIRDTGGREIGEHEGLPAYTIGQRKRLRLKTPEVFYVVRIDPDENVLIVGKENDLIRKHMELDKVNWVEGDGVSQVFIGKVKIRSQHRPAEAVVRAFPDRAEIEFMEKQKAITPGQSAAVYIGDELIGGGIISGSR